MATFGTTLGIVLSGIVLVGLAIIVLHYQREMRTARDRINRLNSQVIETDCGPIEYLRMGEGYPVLVVHGALGGFDQGVWLARGYDISNYQIIAVSRFGHLGSPVPLDATLDTQADAFACLLDALGIQQAAVVAVSGGSTSAIRFAARHPERVSALILLCPDAPPGIPLPPRFVFDTLLRSDFLYWLVVSAFPKTVQKQAGFVPNGYVTTPETEAVIKQILKGNLPISKRIDGFLFESYTTDAEFQASITVTSPYPLNKIETPMLVIDALDDPIAITENVRRLAEQMPNARLFLVPQGGHFFFGHTEEVKSEIAQFLRNSAQISLENRL